jgi:hypothetical protein
LRSFINETMTEARTPQAQRVLQLYNDVQLCREMGWTQGELEDADDDFIWFCMQVLGLEGEKARNDEKRGSRHPDAMIHHEIG